jgi:hypothetical protein
MQKVMYAGTTFVIDDELWTRVERVFDVLTITGGSFTAELPVHLGDEQLATRVRVRLVARAPWVAAPDRLIPEDADSVGKINAINAIDSFLQSSLRDNQDVQNLLARFGYFAH